MQTRIGLPQGLHIVRGDFGQRFSKVLLQVGGGHAKLAESVRHFFDIEGLPACFQGCDRYRWVDDPLRLSRRLWPWSGFRERRGRADLRCRLHRLWMRGFCHA
ncbi:MAG: hypothetical protein HQL95_00665 [Magnetococcales bacterium]|nr:hypothetical protein [Magnetococcales bacterium]